MLKKIGTKQIVPLVIAVICGIFLVTGLTKFGFWNATTKSPTPAFVPSIICTLLIAICLITVFTSLKKGGKAEYHWDEFLVILTAGAIIGCTYLIGMLPALGLFVLLWLKLVEHTPWKTTIIILAIVAALVIGVFVLWLGVRFPTGLIYDAIANR